ncbi:MAG: alpha/beta hydrolase [Anaerolineales bacterium]|nr:alpha/beta hydrolase [Anaerolineales bacterium]
MFGMVKPRIFEGLEWGIVVSGLVLGLLLVSACQSTPLSSNLPPFKLIPFDSKPQEVRFSGHDGVSLAGQFDWPPNSSQPALVFIIHHADPIDRNYYQYMAARLVPAGYAVFRFDKRGTGQSGGVYGCCEADDALAAYRAAIAQKGFDPTRVFIVAQSIGTKILAERFDEFAQIHQPAGVVLLSNLLKFEEILAIKTPLHIIVSDSEPELAAIGQGAARAHQTAYDYGASFYIAPQTEHSLFDISNGPIDWADPTWPDRFHNGTWVSLINWLNTQANSPGFSGYNSNFFLIVF